jgi:sulfite exporter TauE/SafE
VLSPVAWSALVMGVVGGSHCLAMCSAPCGALIGGRDTAAVGPALAADAQTQVHWLGLRGGRQAWRSAVFHAGRLGGYAVMGALAGAAMDSLAWLTQQAVALQSVWTLMHVAVMGWGLMMVFEMRQPIWMERAGRVVWGKVQPIVRSNHGLLTAGVLWGLMPCGLLYSALLVAALSGGALEGALSMVLFGLGSGIWLVGGPWAWTLIKARVSLVRAAWGSRIAGGLLCSVAAWALWMDLVYKPSLWCR